MRLGRTLSWSAVFCVAAAALAYAAVITLSPPALVWGSGNVVTPTPMSLIGYDSTSGNACIVGATASCSLAISSAGGGGALVQTPCGGASSCVLKASAGLLYDAYVSNATAGWLYAFNSTTAPVNGAVTAGKASGNYQECIPVQANGSAGLIVGDAPPVVFSVGVTLVFSSTACGTLTLATAGFLTGRVQ